MQGIVSPCELHETNIFFYENKRSTFSWQLRVDNNPLWDCYQYGVPMLEEIKVNLFKSLQEPTVISTITLKECYDLIKLKSKTSERILQIRNGIYPKTKHGKTLSYNESKRLDFHCVAYNFLFDNYKSDKNIIAPTGLMYLDIDDDRFNINLLDTSKILSYNKSFGGKGYSILVRVEGLTLENFNITFNGIVKDLSLDKYVDLNVRKATQFNLLSYDENIFINPNPKVYLSRTFEVENNFSPQPKVKENRKKAFTIGCGENKKIRFDNLDEFNIDGKYTVCWDGVSYIKCEIPWNKLKSNRHRFLSAYCQNLVYLNQWLNFNDTFLILEKVNDYACLKPKGKKELKSIVNSVIKYRDNGTLTPIYYYKLKKFFFSKDEKFQKHEHLKIMNKAKSERARQEVYNVLESWDFEKYGKITGEKIKKYHKIGKHSVDKYLKEFRQYKNDLNGDYMSTL